MSPDETLKQQEIRKMTDTEKQIFIEWKTAVLMANGRDVTISEKSNQYNERREFLESIGYTAATAERFVKA